MWQGTLLWEQLVPLASPPEGKGMAGHQALRIHLHQTQHTPCFATTKNSIIQNRSSMLKIGQSTGNETQKWMTMNLPLATRPNAIMILSGVLLLLSNTSSTSKRVLSLLVSTWCLWSICPGALVQKRHGKLGQEPGAVSSLDGSAKHRQCREGVKPIATIEKNTRRKQSVEWPLSVFQRIQNQSNLYMTGCKQSLHSTKSKCSRSLNKRSPIMAKRMLMTMASASMIRLHQRYNAKMGRGINY